MEPRQRAAICHLYFMAPEVALGAEIKTAQAWQREGRGGLAGN